MKQSELNKILEQHELWLKNEGGKRAHLNGAHLRNADLSGANLRRAHLRNVDLSGANLSCVDLSGAHLRGTNLSGTNLKRTNLSGTDLYVADLSGADLSGADLDFSVLNLSCKGLNFKIDERIARQIAYHLINLCNYSDIDYKYIIKTVNGSHLISDHNLEKVEL